MALRDEAREILQEIKDTATTSLKPDVYPSEERWMRDRLIKIEILAGRAERLLKLDSESEDDNDEV